MPDEHGHAARHPAALLAMARGHADDGRARCCRAARRRQRSVESLRVRTHAFPRRAGRGPRAAPGRAAAGAGGPAQCAPTAPARAQQASRARYQAATLQTELLRLQPGAHKIDARRRSTERARAELAGDQRAALAQGGRSRGAAGARCASRPRATAHRAVQPPPPRTTRCRRCWRWRGATAQPLAVVIIDLDHFKAVSTTTTGHAAGDRLLAAFGALLAAQGRQQRRGLPLRRRGVLPADAAHRGWRRRKAQDAGPAAMVVRSARGCSTAACCRG